MILFCHDCGLEISATDVRQSMNMHGYFNGLCNNCNTET